MAENEPRTQERGGFGILGVYLVGGGDTPTARSRCVGFSDGLYGRSRRRARPAIVVNHVEYRSCRLTGEWSMNDYSRTMGPKPAMKRTLTFATPAMTSPLVEMKAVKHTLPIHVNGSLGACRDMRHVLGM